MDVLFTVWEKWKIVSPASGEAYITTEQSGQTATLSKTQELAVPDSGLRIKVVCMLGSYPTPEPYPWPCSKCF